MNKYLEILKKLKSFNDKILELKNIISESLKKYSFNSLNDLVNRINDKRTSYLIKHQKLSHVKNTFSLINNIFEKRNLIEQTKDKIIENINQVNLVRDEISKKKAYFNEKRLKNFNKINDKILDNNRQLEQIKNAKDQIKRSKETLIQLENIKQEEKQVKDAKDQINRTKETLIQLGKIKEQEKQVKNAKDQINRTKQTLIQLGNLKQQEKQIKEEQSFLQNKIQEIEIKKLNKNKQAELRIIAEKNLKMHRAQKLKEERNQFFLQKIDEIKKVQNRTETTIKLINMHHDLVNRLVNTLLYLKQLKETHKHIQEKKERIIIFEKVKQARGIIQEMKQIINNTKSIIEQQEENKTIQDGYDSVYNQLIEKVQSLKSDLKNSNTGDNINKIREKLKKLTDLYKILKSGSAHNALRNELMKKLVNINSSMVQSVNIFKLQNEINLLK